MRLLSTSRVFIAALPVARLHITYIICINTSGVLSLDSLLSSTANSCGPASTHLCEQRKKKANDCQPFSWLLPNIPLNNNSISDALLTKAKFLSSVAACSWTRRSSLSNKLYKISAEWIRVAPCQAQIQDRNNTHSLWQWQSTACCKQDIPKQSRECQFLHDGLLNTSVSLIEKILESPHSFDNMRNMFNRRVMRLSV